MSELGNPDLANKMIREIEASVDRVIPFRRFMELCLYDEEGGYYTSDRPKTGKEGDFYTSPAIGGIMGECIACFIAATLTPLFPLHEIVEWGGGDGRLARDILDALQDKHPRLYDRISYTMIERSPYHRRLQRDMLAGHAAKLRFADGEEWLSSSEERAEGVLVLSNELLDAFPVDRVRMRRDGLMELVVGWDGEQFTEHEIPCADERLTDYTKKSGLRLMPGQTVEINIGAERWISRVFRRIRTGHVLTIDYGDVADALYAEHRMAGTLMCYRKHTAHDDPYIHIGEQDMTAHVDFSALMREGDAEGASNRLWTQREFLVEAGILRLLQNHSDPDPFSAAARRNRAIRQLILGDRMSELFKVLLQTKQLPAK